MYSRNEVAKVLAVTPARVSQIAASLGIDGHWQRGTVLYRLSELRQMQQRDKKPGPKPTTKGKSK